jgi:flagellar biosynthetic protein FliP
MLLLTILSLAPSILILVTCFLRFSIVLDFIKRALSLQQVPPTAVLNGIALFMTLFVMWPTFSTMYEKSFKPLSQGEIGIEQAYEQAETPLRMFMYSQMSEDTSYIKMFMSMAKLEKPNTLKDVPTYILVPSYILHELTVAFKIGVLLYIPFIIIDMIVASILMSMGMMMLPPVQISMPFKLILFVLIDGWGLLTQQLFISVIK